MALYIVAERHRDEWLIVPLPGGKKACDNIAYHSQHDEAGVKNVIHILIRDSPVDDIRQIGGKPRVAPTPAATLTSTHRSSRRNAFSSANTFPDILTLSK